jgi:hypothetical protein
MDQPIKLISNILEREFMVTELVEIGRFRSQVRS